MAKTPRPEQADLPESADSTTVERHLWDVPTATFVSVTLSDAELVAKLAQGQHQNLGDRFLVNGLGEPAPPLRLTVTPDAADPLRVAIALSGGAGSAAAVTLFYGDGTTERHEGAAGTDLGHTYAFPGTFTVLAINDYGQEAAQVVTLAPAEAEPPPA